MDTSDPTLLARPPVDVNMPEGFAHGWLMSYDAPQGLFSVLLDDGNAITVGKRHMTWMAPEAGHRGTRLIDQRDLGRNVIISRTLSEHEESWSQSPLVADNSGIARFDDESVPSGKRLYMFFKRNIQAERQLLPSRRCGHSIRFTLANENNDVKLGAE